MSLHGIDQHRDQRLQALAADPIGSFPQYRQCPPYRLVVHPGHKIYPYLLRQLSITRANQVWALDTTYIPMARGFVYLTAVVDVVSRKVLAHKVAITLEACHATEVIEQALARYGTPEIVNIDQGNQFTAEEFTRVVLDQGCKLSMDGRGAWRDNVFVERLWRSVKYERVYLKAYDSVSAARTDIAEYLSWYNTHRSHSSLGRITPDEQYLAAQPCAWLRKMKSRVRPELPTAALRSSQATHAAVDNSASSAIRPESTYKSGKVVQTNGTTSLEPQTRSPRVLRHEVESATQGEEAVHHA